MDIILYICLVIYVFIISFICWIPGLYIESLKYSTLKHFLDSYDNLSKDDLLSFIDSLHFRDREAALRKILHSRKK